MDFPKDGWIGRSMKVLIMEMGFDEDAAANFSPTRVAKNTPRMLPIYNGRPCDSLHCSCHAPRVMSLQNCSKGVLGGGNGG